jgi:DNA invertase Pin-like site-specific DNA recombinase
VLVGYARVSTVEQNLDLQLDALTQAKCEKIFKDMKSGAKAERPGLSQALAYMREGDVLTVWKLDRLGVAARKQWHVSSQTRGIFGSHSAPTRGGLGSQSPP